MASKDLIEKLKNGLVFLFLGQGYLSLETGSDPLLKDTLQKYSTDTNDNSEGYHSIFKSNLQENKEGTLGWMNNRCDRLSAPEWLKTISKFPWNGVYTTAIDTLWYKTFRTDWRTLTPIYDKKYNPPDIRSRTRLHGTFLFGSIGGDNENRPPFTKREWLKRKLESSPILVRLREIVTPLGVLIVEGYATNNDWLPFDEFVPVIDSLNNGQVHFFSVSDSYYENEDFKQLVDSGKIIAYSESLASFLLNASNQGSIKLDEKPEDYGEHTVKILDETFTVPTDLWNQVSKSALILEDKLFQIVNKPSETRYSDFLTFLHNSSNIPVWEGYLQGFAFQRNYETILWNKVKYALENVDKINEPIVLHGQSGTGKTISLGKIAYEIRKKLSIPVLFIERKSSRPSSSDLDEFCKWAEDNKASSVLIIWDGMEEPDQYYQILRYLLGRGRKVSIVGSSYKQNEKIDTRKKDNFIEAPSHIDDDEKQKLSGFLKKIDNDINLERLLGKNKQDVTFFVALYRLLPPTRNQLRQSLNKEVLQAEVSITQKADENPPIPSTTLGLALFNAGFKPDSNTFTGVIQQIEGEDLNFINKLIGLIMVPGRFGLKVPFELLLRALKTEWMDQLTDYLDQDIFRWDENVLGQISIGPRHPLEAELIVQYRFGSANAEISLAKDLLLEIADTENGDSPDIQFAVDLLRSMGPNGRNWEYFAPLSLKISKILEELREKIGIINSRLLLQEASLLRETVVWHTRKNMHLENSIVLLQIAETILRLALSILDSRNLRLRHVILVELGTLLATKTKQLLDHNQANDIDVTKLFWQARESLNKTIVLAPEDYHPVDVLSWASLMVLKSHTLQETDELEVRADLLHVLFSLDGEGYDPEQQKKFQERRLEVADFIKNRKLADDAFNALVNQGSKAGYYLRAVQPISKYLFSGEFENSQIDEFTDAAKYLEKNRQNISGDGKCLSLLLRTWWISKAKKPLLTGERQAVPFSQGDWSYARELTKDILGTDEVYATPIVRYIHCISLFHLGEIENSMRAFRELEREAETMQGRKRIVRSYLVSDSNGKPKEYNGQVAWINEKGDRGQVYVEELYGRVLFIPFDFYSGKELRKNDSLPKFHIAFNFIGPIADSTKHYSRK